MSPQTCIVLVLLMAACEAHGANIVYWDSPPGTESVIGLSFFFF